MEIILKQDIKGLGYKNDTVTVKPGYGRNYLIPQGLAILANKSNRKMIDENIRQAAHKAAKLQADAEALADEIGDMVFTIITKAGESGKIFGAITALQVADELSDKGFEIDRKQVSFPDPIKTIGDHKVILEIHKKVKKEITITVVAE